MTEEKEEKRPPVISGRAERAGSEEGETVWQKEARGQQDGREKERKDGLFADGIFAEQQDRGTPTCSAADGLPSVPPTTSCLICAGLATDLFFYALA